MILIIDYGMGNLGSIANMLKKIGVKTLISSKKEEIENAEKLILPGVGNFDHGMRKLHELDLVESLKKRVLEDEVPILGICLGMQLLTKSSEEGILEGLSIIEAETLHFSKLNKNSPLRIPHMGWNEVRLKKMHFLFEDMPESPKFYFVHSYFVFCNDEADILTSTSYGNDFTSSFQKDNIMGVQFHPEKSHKYGMQLLRNFSKHL